MIHYGLQYNKILELLAREAASARCVLHDAAYAVGEARETLKTAILAEEAASVKSAVANAALHCALDQGPIAAVEAYRAKNGKYPI